MASNMQDNEENNQELKVKEQVAKDAEFISAMLKGMGLTEYEPQVVNRLLMVAYGYGYSTCVLEKSEEISDNASDVKDPKLENAKEEEKKKSGSSTPKTTFRAPKLARISKQNVNACFTIDENSLPIWISDPASEPGAPPKRADNS